MTNADYALRKVTASEIIQRFGGSAVRAMKATGGRTKLACFYLANPNAADPADPATIESADPLHEELAEEIEAEKIEAERITYRIRVESAAQAYNLAGTLSSIMGAVHCGHPMARNLLESAKARGLIREPHPKPRKPKCPSPTEAPSPP